MAGKPIVISPVEKNILLTALEGAKNSALRLSRRDGQLAYAIDAYKKSADEINDLQRKVSTWDVNNT